MGLVHIYCGDGKGKTTASIGLAVRFAGSGRKVLFCQFMKNGKSSELPILRQIDKIILADAYHISKFSFQMNDEEKKTARIGFLQQFENIKKIIIAEEIEMVVLDEIMSCINAGFIDENEVLDFIDENRDRMEIVLSGRNPSDRLIEKADYVSEVKKVKHPFDRGIGARSGVEK